MTRSPGQSSWTPWLLIGPFLVIFVTFTAYPAASSIWLSTRQTFGPGFSVGVGEGNFAHIASDPSFWKALKNTVVYTLGAISVQLPLSLVLALLLNRPDIRARALFRVILFSPVLVGVVFVAMLFSVLFEKRTGLINQLLHSSFGWDLEFPWLETYVMPALIIATVWQYVGFSMVYFLAALQNVSRELIEASLIDNAGPLSRFRHVTLPAIRPVLTFVLLLSIIGCFQVFELPYILMNGTGGPENRGLTLVMYLYQTGFQTGDLGLASAIGWVMTIVLGMCAIAQFLLTDRTEAA